MFIRALTGCGANAGNDSISVLTREEGPGTIGAFIELFGYLIFVIACHFGNSMLSGLIAKRLSAKKG